MLEAMASGLGNLFSPEGFGLLLLGVVAGIVFGAVPGIGGITALVMFLPFIVGLPPEKALLLFIGVGAAVHTGDTIPAVLFSVPGTGAAMCTVVDGHPMAMRGEGARALGAAYTASLIGGLVGAVFLMATVPIVQPLVLLMGSPELFMVALTGLSVVGVLSGRRPVIGMGLGLLGLLIGQIGLHPQTGVYRWSFGVPYLVDGLPLLPAVLGLFGFAEMADLAIRGKTSVYDVQRIGKGVLTGVRDTLRNWFLVLRSSAIGVWMGVVPAVGGGSATWVAYGTAAQTCKNNQNFGKGDVRGVIAPEAANNASLGGDLLPTIAFAVPGSTSMVLYLAAFLMLGIVPGPDFFTKHLDLVFTMGWGIAVGNVIAAVLCMALSTQIAKVLQLPVRFLAPLILVFIFAGAAMTTASMWDLYTLVFFGILGYVLKRLGWPRPPLVLGLVLGPVLEKFLFISTTRYGAAWLLRPGVIGIGVLIIASFVYGAMGGKKTLEAGT
ncbi:MAG: tripartite tricarboxylate transporter permease [Chloroflexi bacterium]|nr:tripartite tricarboxylate transporter permease [Chloroflexota bacterium]